MTFHSHILHSSHSLKQLSAGLALFFIFICSSSAAPQTQDLPAPVQPSPATISLQPDVLSPEVQLRLASLIPADPEAYFKLAEELADRTESPLAIRTARELCVLAFVLWRDSSNARQSAPTLGTSSLLLLASFSTQPGVDQWLTAMAAGLDEQGLVNPPNRADPARQSKAASSAVVLDLVSALELLRAGDGRRSAKILNKPEVFQLLLKHEKMLSPAGLPGEADRLKKLATDWPICFECRNRRSVKGPEGVRLCPSCNGDPGPPLKPIEGYYHLRLEAVLLEGTQTSWAAQTLVDQGRPLRELDPAEIPPTFNVDPSKTIWRDGRWVAPSPPNTSASTEKSSSRPSS